MKPPLFRVGQAVVFVDKLDCSTVVGPQLKVGTVYHVRSGEWFCGANWIGLREYPAIAPHDWVWEEKHFAPAEYLADEALAKLLEESLETVTA